MIEFNNDLYYSKEEINRITFFDKLFFKTILDEYWWNGILIKDILDGQSYIEIYETKILNFKVNIMSNIHKDIHIIRIFKDSFKKPIATKKFKFINDKEAIDFININISQKH